MVGGVVEQVAITVRSGGSGDPALNFVAAAFQEATGYSVKITYDNNLANGDRRVFDVVVAANDVLERELRPAGMVEEGGIHIGSTKLGVTVRPGAPAPDISSMEAFKRALFEADAFLTTTHSSGLHVEAMLKRVGVYKQIESRIERYPNGPALMERLLRGKGKEFSLLSINQIRRYQDQGLVLVGLAPEEAQHQLKFVAVPMTGSTNKEMAWEFARFCAGPGRPLLVAHGFS